MTNPIPGRRLGIPGSTRTPWRPASKGGVAHAGGDQREGRPAGERLLGRRAEPVGIVVVGVAGASGWCGARSCPPRAPPRSRGEEGKLRRRTAARVDGVRTVEASKRRRHLVLLPHANLPSWLRVALTEPWEATLEDKAVGVRKDAHRGRTRGPVFVLAFRGREGAGREEEQRGAREAHWKPRRWGCPSPTRAERPPGCAGRAGCCGPKKHRHFRRGAGVDFPMAHAYSRSLPSDPRSGPGPPAGGCNGGGSAGSKPGAFAEAKPPGSAAASGFAHRRCGHLGEVRVRHPQARAPPHDPHGSRGRDQQGRGGGRRSGSACCARSLGASTSVPARSEGQSDGPPWLVSLSVTPEHGPPGTHDADGQAAPTDPATRSPFSARGRPRRRPRRPPARQGAPAATWGDPPRPCGGSGKISVLGTRRRCQARFRPR